MATITAANAVLMLSVDNLFPAPIQIQGFSADDVFNTDDIDNAETAMGVDGILSAGFIFTEIKWYVTLQADSPSAVLFDNIYSAEQQIVEKYRIQGIVRLPSVGMKWVMKNGVLSTYKPMPDGKKVLQPRKFGITWERVSPSLV